MTQCQSVSISIGGEQVDSSKATIAYENGALQITGLETATSAGIWSGDVAIELVGHQSGGRSPGWGGNWGGGWKENW